MKYSDSHDDLEVVVKIWEEILSDDVTDHNLDFVSAGGDSILAVELLERLESAFPGADFGATNDLSWLTIRDTVSYLRGFPSERS